jgi:hypothetical protein
MESNDGRSEPNARKGWVCTLPNECSAVQVGSISKPACAFRETLA